VSNIDLKCGDAIELLKNLPDCSVDLIVADPPYNLGKDYGNNHDLKGFDEYIEFSKSWLSEASRVLKPTGTIYVFMGVRFISYLYDILDRDLKLFFNFIGVALSTISIPLFSISPAFTNLFVKPAAPVVATGTIWFLVLVLYQEKSKPNLFLNNFICKPASQDALCSGFKLAFFFVPETENNVLVPNGSGLT